MLHERSVVGMGPIARYTDVVFVRAIFPMILQRQHVVPVDAADFTVGMFVAGLPMSGSVFRGWGIVSALLAKEVFCCIVPLMGLVGCAVSKPHIASITVNTSVFGFSMEFQVLLVVVINLAYIAVSCPVSATVLIVLLPSFFISELACATAAKRMRRIVFEVVQ